MSLVESGRECLSEMINSGDGTRAYRKETRGEGGHHLAPGTLHKLVFWALVLIFWVMSLRFVQIGIRKQCIRSLCPNGDAAQLGNLGMSNSGIARAAEASSVTGRSDGSH